MKKFKTTLALIAICGLAFTSCSDDDDDSSNSPTGSNPPASTSAISFDGQNYLLKDGLSIDWGTVSISFFGEATHYNKSFVMVDDQIIVSQDSAGNDEFAPGNNTTISINADLYSPDTTEFKAGTFTFINSDTASVAFLRGKYFFDNFSSVELNSGGITGDTLSGPEFEVTGGSIIVTGTSLSDYKFDLNLQLEGGRTLTGTYSGRLLDSGF